MSKGNGEKIHPQVGKAALFTLAAAGLFIISGMLFASARDELDTTYPFAGFDIPGWGMTFIMLIFGFAAVFWFFYVAEEKPTFFNLRYELYYLVSLVCILIAVFIIIMIGESLWEAILYAIGGIIVSMVATYILKEIYGDIVGDVTSSFVK